MLSIDKKTSAIVPLSHSCCNTYKSKTIYVLEKELGIWLLVVDKQTRGCLYSKKEEVILKDTGIDFKDTLSGI